MGELLDIHHMASHTAVAAGHPLAAVDVIGRWERDLAAQGGLHQIQAHWVVALSLVGELDEALRQASLMRDGWERLGSPAARWMTPSVYAAAFVHALRGDDAGFQEWAGLANRMGRHHTLEGFAAFADARIALHRGRVAGIEPLLEPVVTEHFGIFGAYAEGAQAELAVAAGAPDAAQRIERAAAVAEESDWAAACLARARGRLLGDRGALEEALARWERIGARFERACTLLLLDGRAGEGHAELGALGCSPAR